ncbi:M48 family metallopeptidase [Tateyamaria omphalii]|uniref:Peptidase M48 Ste24p n=1 Tax=Tateyamaria omphalii TaxID=299262 RepID=A0A1P8MWV7_9RHOB|nr:M48 family metallopeptidase [Tateyamaria omphalii]APX12576.1 peptidase M48 Ste24p [Tateyamaria omphalii]
MTKATYFDGDTPTPVPVYVMPSSDRAHLVLAREDAADINWPVADVRAVEDHPAGIDTVLRLTTDPVARLYVPNAGTLPPLPNLHRAAPPEGRGRLALWATGAVAAVALQIGVLIPLMADQLANFIPPRAERALGEATFNQIRDALGNDALGPLRICEAHEGRAALDDMAAIFAPAMPEGTEISVFVLNHRMINAFALPGGYVVFFRGLIDAAETPEEVAAVFAHELGHVVSRDPTRHALRSAGSIGVLGLLFGDFAGGAVVLFLAERLIDANYTQGAEEAADTFAHAALEQAGISPAALGDMFQRLKDEHGESDGIVAHFLSHPSLSDRIDRAEAAVPDGQTWTPVLTEDQWAALQAICED